ncbi:MAG TPA: TIGR04063 family PEP-CTERM/XrtA system glycosyltransferase [Arenibaculum sp.]|nr:TIGR04063 family PEP-CTERM/XrtA system glycosyltransferase [Arenibaculum sp.]
MRILHILDHSLPLQSGYSFRTLSILKGQRALGWDVRCVTTPRHTRAGPAEDVVEGFRFHRTAAPKAALSGMPAAREVGEMRATAASIRRICEAWRPDVLHAHSPVLNVLPALATGRRLGIPVVYEVRAFWEDAASSHGSCVEGSVRYRASRFLETLALRRVDAITTICEGLRDDMVARGIPAARITIVSNSVDARGFAPAARKDPDLLRRHGLGTDIVCGFIGSFYRYEGLALLLHAMAEIVRRRDDMKLLLVGGGPEDRRLRVLAAELRLDGKVIFTGRVPHGDVDAYYSLVDLLVYPRLPQRITELVTPLKPLESLAMGKIVVASAVGGHRELLRGAGPAMLFAPGSVPGLVDAVLSAAERRKDWPEMGAQGRRYVVENCDWTKAVARYERVYHSLAGSGPPGPALA